MIEYQLDKDSFTNIKNFVDTIARILKVNALKVDNFIEKWVFLYKSGTQFATEYYPAFSSMLTNAYHGAYINNQKTIEKVTHFIEETNELRKERNQYLDQINALSAKEQTKNIEDINGIQFLFVEESKDVASAKQMAFDLRDQLQHGFVVMVNTYEGKISYFVALTKSMVKDGYKAGDMIKTINQVTNGRGGGKPDFAQGGCQDASQIKEAIAQIKAQF